MTYASFHDQTVAILPELRLQALALTRNRAAAEDLIQDAVCSALAAYESFTPGTNFAGWMHRIVRNSFISDVRKRHPVIELDGASVLSAVNASQEDRTTLRELRKAIHRLPADNRVALIMVVVHGMTYEALAEATGCAVGTAKSRVFRARKRLREWLLGDNKLQQSGLLRRLPAAEAHGSDLSRAAVNDANR